MCTRIPIKEPASQYLTSKPQFGSSSLLAGISKIGSSDYVHTLQHRAEKQLVPESQI